jgi:hypothetical protein
MYSDNITSIDINLTDKFNEPVARAFACNVCKQIPINAVNCKNKSCAKIFCEECVKSRCPKCLEKDTISELGGNLKEILQLIKFKCPYYEDGCAVSMGHKKFFDHVKDVCKFKKRPREESEEDEEIYPSTKNKKILDPNDFRSNRDMQISTFNFSKLDIEELKMILFIRNLPTNGSKKDLILRVDCYFNQNTSFFTDDKIRKMFINDSIEDLSKTDLFHLLFARGLKTSGNKSENILNLKKYII